MTESLQVLSARQVGKLLNLNISQSNIMLVTKNLFQNLRIYQLVIESRVDSGERSFLKCTGIVISHDLTNLENMKKYMEENYSKGNIDELSFRKDIKRKFGIELKGNTGKGRKYPIFNSANEFYGEILKNSFHITEVSYI